MATTRTRAAKPAEDLGHQVDGLLDRADQACEELKLHLGTEESAPARTGRVGPPPALEGQVDALLSAGSGQCVDISSLDAQLAALTDGLLDGDIEGPQGQLVGSVSPPLDAEAPAQETLKASGESAPALDGAGEAAAEVPPAVVSSEATSPGVAETVVHETTATASDVVVEVVRPTSAVEAQPAATVAPQAPERPVPPAEPALKSMPPVVQVSAPVSTASVAMSPVEAVEPVAAKNDRGTAGRLLHRTLALASAPLNGRPQVVRDSIGWLALWTGFLAVCVLMAVLVFRKTAAPDGSAEGTALAGEGDAAHAEGAGHGEPKVDEHGAEPQEPAANPDGWQIRTSGGH